MAAVYGTAPVAIVREPGMAPSHALEVVDGDHVEGAPIGTALRRRIIEAAAAKSARITLRLCVVFADDDCVFVEPDGTAVASSTPPHGGLRLERRP